MQKMRTKKTTEVEADDVEEVNREEVETCSNEIYRRILLFSHERVDNHQRAKKICLHHHRHHQPLL